MQLTSETKSWPIGKIGIRNLRIIQKSAVVIASIVSTLVAFGSFTAIAGITISSKYETGTSAETFIPLLILCIIYSLPSYWLWMLSKNLKYAINSENPQFFERVLMYLKLLFGFMVALCVIILCASIPSIFKFTSSTFSYFFK